MNISAAIELALADVIRNSAEGVPGTVIRAWRTLSEEQALAEGPRKFPMISISASTKGYDENQATNFCDVVILCGTFNEDDKNHANCAALAEQTETGLDALFDQFMDNSPGDAYNLFTSRMAADYTGTFNLGGFSWTGNEPPYEDGGINLIGMSFRVHFSR